MERLINFRKTLGRNFDLLKLILSSGHFMISVKPVKGNIKLTI